MAPAFICLPIFIALDLFFDHTDAVNPRYESFDNAIASSIVSYGITPTMGPKVSSFIVSISWLTSVSTIHGINWPFLPLTLDLAYIVAPFLTASSI